MQNIIKKDLKTTMQKNLLKNGIAILRESRPSQHRVMAFLLLAVGLCLLFVTPFFIKASIMGDLHRYDSQTFNLVFCVPSVLWIGVFILGLLLVLFSFSKLKGFSPNSTNILIFLLVLILLLLFYGFPYLIESNPRFIDSWVHGKSAKGILENGNLQPEQFKYHAYPASFILLSCLSLVTNIDLTSLLMFTPIIYIVLFFTSLTLLFTKILPDLKLASISTLIYGLSTFYLSFHFSPEIFGWTLFFLFLVVIGKESMKSKTDTNLRINIVLLITIIIGITITHLVTQVMMILTLSMFIILPKKFKNRFLTYKLLLFAAIASLVYFFSFSFSYIHGIIEGFKTALETVLYDVTSSIAAQPLTTYSPPEVAHLLLYRRLLYLAVIITALFGAYMLKKEKKKPFMFLFSLLLTSALLVPLTVFGILPLERSIKLAFIPLSIFSTYFLFKRRRIGIVLLAILILSIPINFAAVYWNEAGRYQTYDWEIASAKFTSSHFHGTLLAESKETSILNFYGNFTNVFSDFRLLGERPDVFTVDFIDEQNIELVQITQITILRNSWAERNLNFNLFLNSSTFNCVYSNGYSMTFLRNNATSKAVE